MAKKLIALITCLILGLSLVACNQSVDSENSTPNEPVLEYPYTVVQAEGVNKYENIKREAPTKTENVTQYQDYAIEQIDAYLNAIKQDETVTYNTRYIELQINKRKYAIYTEQNPEKIDLMLIDVENLIKKYILIDEDYVLLESFLKSKSFVRSSLAESLVYYYGKYENTYFFVLTKGSFAEMYFEVGDCTFWSAGSRMTPLWSWTVGEKEIYTIEEAYSKGKVTNEQITELYEIELIRPTSQGIYTYYGSTSDQTEIFTTNLFDIEENGDSFVINLCIGRTLRYKEDLIEYKAKILASFLHVDPFKYLPTGVTSVEFGAVDDSGAILRKKSFSAEKREEHAKNFLGTGTINYERSGKIISVSMGSLPALEINLKMIDPNKLEGFIRLFVTLEYENGNKETCYGAPIYYLIKEEYDAEQNAIVRVYQFSAAREPIHK